MRKMRNMWTGTVEPNQQKQLNYFLTWTRRRNNDFVKIKTNGKSSSKLLLFDIVFNNSQDSCPPRHRANVFHPPVSTLHCLKLFCIQKVLLSNLVCSFLSLAAMTCLIFKQKSECGTYRNWMQVTAARKGEKLTAADGKRHTRRKWRKE